MKQAILLAVFITATHICYAQVKSPGYTSHLPEKADSSSDRSAMTQQMLTEIMNAVGLQPNFELREAKVLNIEASISHRKRYILYNSSFITWINDVTKNKWAAIALLAHEIGHHLNGHTIKKTGSTPRLELEADEFAGFILHKLGASLVQAQEVMNYIAKTEPSNTHPARTSRILAIQTGWNKAADNSAIALKKESSLHPDKSITN